MQRRKAKAIQLSTKNPIQESDSKIKDYLKLYVENQIPTLRDYLVKLLTFKGNKVTLSSPTLYARGNAVIF